LCGNWQDYYWQDASRGHSVMAELLVSKKYQNNCEEDNFNDYAPCAEMHPMYQVTRLSWIISSAATCVQRKE